MYDSADWLPDSAPTPVGSAEWEAAYLDAYRRWQAAGRKWLDQHDLPGLEAAMAIPDQPFDPAAEGVVSIGRHIDIDTDTDTEEA